MDIERIQSFLVLAKFLNFTKASEYLYITQPVLSRQIAALEKEIGISLFTRTKRSVVLTPAGKELADGLKRVVDLYDSVIENAVSISTGYKGALRICAVAGQTVGSTIAPIISAFEAKYPDISIDVSCENLSEIKYKLQEGQIDIVYGRLIDFSHLDDLCCTPISNVKVCFVCSSKHPLAQIDPTSFKEEHADKYPFLWSRDLESDVVKALLDRREKRTGSANVKFSPTLNVMLAQVELGKGFTYLNECSYFRYNPSVCFIPLPNLGYTTEYFIWKNQNTNPSLEILKEFCEEYRNSFHIEYSY